MSIRLSFQLLFLFCIFSVTHAQDEQTPSVNIGDMAPPLKVQEWIKGTPVETFEKGKVYVVEFWATWCKPCIEAVPRLSALARKYRNKVTFIGMDIYEHSDGMNIPLAQVKKIVDSMGKRMDYVVAAEDSNFMETGYMLAANVESIPQAFVINAEGRLAWIGHPEYLSSVLPKILNNTWNIKDALATRVSNQYLAKLDDSLSQYLRKYIGDDHNPNDMGEPDSALYIINQIIQKEPRLKYAPVVGGNTFVALVKTDPHRAYEFGKVMIVTPTYDDEPAYNMIINIILFDTDKLKFTPEIYELGAEAYKLKINNLPYRRIINFPRYYSVMATWYSLANDKSNAVRVQRKAIKAVRKMLKQKKKFYSKTDLVAFRSQLKQYKRR